MARKYEMTDETIVVDGHTLHRIRALADIPGRVKKGELGGFIEREENLSQYGLAWVFSEYSAYNEPFSEKIVGKVSGGAHIYGNASICGTVSGQAQVGDAARVTGTVSDDAQIYDHAIVNGRVFDHATVCGNAFIGDKALVYGTAKISDKMYLRAGEWTASPLYIQGTKVMLTVSGPTTVYCGTENFTWKRCHKSYRLIGLKFGWDKRAESEFIAFFNLACQLYGHEDCMITK